MVALAGPAVNVVIALAIVRAGSDARRGRHDGAREPARELFARVAAANVFLVVFNLIPAFPMDGGRVLRALLAMRMGRAEATRVAARIGQGAAFLFALAGLFVNPMLIVIGLFVYLAATAEAQHVAFRDGTQGLPVRDSMMTPVEHSGRPDLDDAVDLLLRTAQKEFPIVDGSGRPRGLLYQGRADRRAAPGRPGPPVLDSMVREVPSAGLAPFEAGLAPLTQARNRRCSCSTTGRLRRRDHPGERRRDDAGAQRTPGFSLPLRGEPWRVRQRINAARPIAAAPLITILQRNRFPPGSSQGRGGSSTANRAVLHLKALKASP